MIKPPIKLLSQWTKFCLQGKSTQFNSCFVYLWYCVHFLCYKSVGNKNTDTESDFLKKCLWKVDSEKISFMQSVLTEFTINLIE